MAQENQPINDDTADQRTLLERIGASVNEEITSDVTSPEEKKEAGVTRRGFLFLLAGISSIGGVLTYITQTWGQFAPAPGRGGNKYYRSRRRRQQRQDQEKPETPEEKEAKEKAEKEAAEQRETTRQNEEAARFRLQQQELKKPDSIETYVNGYLDINLPYLLTQWGRGKEVRYIFSEWPSGNRKLLSRRQVPLCLAYMVEEYLENVSALEKDEEARKVVREEAKQLFQGAPMLAAAVTENLLPFLQEQLPLRTHYGRVLDLFTLYFIKGEHENGRRVRQWVLQREQARGGNKLSGFPDDALHLSHDCLRSGKGHR